jgi:thiamine-monophosphate kinase
VNRDKNWFKELANGFEDISNEFQISLIGGDVTRGPLNINVVVYGTPYNSIYLTRSGAKEGDIICITKPVGRAKKGLEDFKENNLKSNFLKDYLRPKPQIELGKKISNYATSCIDISDGLLADLNHILTSSKVGASIFLDDIPITSSINDVNAGDDYDLCFTIPAEMMDSSFYKIGEVTEELGIKFSSNKGYDVAIKGFDHFKNE